MLSSTEGNESHFSLYPKASFRRPWLRLMQGLCGVRLLDQSKQLVSASRCDKSIEGCINTERLKRSEPFGGTITHHRMPLNTVKDKCPQELFIHVLEKYLMMADVLSRSLAYMVICQ